MDIRKAIEVIGAHIQTIGAPTPPTAPLEEFLPTWVMLDHLVEYHNTKATDEDKAIYAKINKESFNVGIEYLAHHLKSSGYELVIHDGELTLYNDDNNDGYVSVQKFCSDKPYSYEVLKKFIDMYM